MKLNKVTVSGSTSNLLVAIEDAEGTIYNQVWSLDTIACESESTIGFLNSSNDPDATYDFICSRGTQLSGITFVAAEGFLDETIGKIANKLKDIIKGTEKFGKVKYNPKKESEVQAIVKNIKKTIGDDKWLEKNYSANGKITISTEFIGDSKKVKPDNWIDMALENIKKTDKMYDELYKLFEKSFKEADKVIDSIEKAISEEKEWDSAVKKIRDVESYQTIYDKWLEDIPGKNSKPVEIEVNCPSAEYLKKLSGILITAIENNFNIDDLESLDILESVFQVLITTGMDESDIKLINEEFVKHITDINELAKTLCEPNIIYKAFYEIIDNILKAGFKK